MSISTLTTLGAARDQAIPKKSDVGKAAAGTPADTSARITDALITSIPTEVVAIYTAAVAAVVGLIDQATGKHYPDQFRILRWWMFASLVVITALSIYLSYRAKSQKRFPLPEMLAGIVAAAVWALSLPASPLSPSLNGDNKALVPTLVLFGGGAVLFLVANTLTKKSS